ncbi:MAG: hypothetical protein Kow0088_25350 [Anaerolineales bacterium]
MSIDELREQASSQAFLEEAPEPVAEQPYRERRFLGLTAFQRFVISILLFMIVCMTGAFFLLVTQRVVLPFIN